jgi:hypothetical protein
VARVDTQAFAQLPKGIKNHDPILAAAAATLAATRPSRGLSTHLPQAPSPSCWVLIQSHEERKADKEVYGIKQATDTVHLATIKKGVVRKLRGAAAVTEASTPEHKKPRHWLLKLSGGSFQTNNSPLPLAHAATRTGCA